MGFGGIIFDYIGAVARWVYGTTWRTIAGKKKYTFKEYLHGTNNSDDWFDQTGHGFVNRLVGVLVILAIIWLIKELE